MKFMELNMDVQLAILEKMYLKDLLSIAQTNQYLLSLSKLVFRQRFLHNRLHIFDPRNTTCNERLDGGQMFMMNYETISKMLKYFGALTSHLKVEFTWNPARSMNTVMSEIFNSVINLVNLHCSESLVEFHIASVYESFFSEISKPFKRVEKVTLQGLFNELNSPNLTFTQLFPAMRSLNLRECPEVLNKSFLDQNFPNLEHIAISMWYDPSHITHADVVKIMENNPQIRSVVLHSCNRNFLKIMSDLLPNLEQLEMENYSTRNEVEAPDQINFKNVKVFKLYSTYGWVPQNIVFENLVELHMEVFPKCTEWRSNILRESKSLKKLHLVSDCVDYKSIVGFIPAESNLEEISLSFCGDVDGISIAKFVRQNQRTDKFHFRMHDIKDSIKSVSQLLQQKFDDKFRVTEGKYDILIERRS